MMAPTVTLLRANSGRAQLRRTYGTRASARPSRRRSRIRRNRTPQRDGTAVDGERRVFWALLMTASFMVADVAGGIISGFPALLVDASQMLTDAAALGLSDSQAELATKIVVGHDEAVA